MTLHVELVVPDGEVWSGEAQLVIAKTLDGDIGVMSGHSPVLGILTPGSVVRIRPDEAGAEGGGRAEISVAVSDGFFSIADNRVSILARQASLSDAIDAAAVQAALDAALGDEAPGPQQEESAQVRYYRAQLRAVGAGS